MSEQGADELSFLEMAKETVGPMSANFRLVYGDAELSVGLPFEAHVEDQLLQLLDTSGSQAADRSRTASRIADVITSMLEADVPAPSEKQIKYAVAIARELCLQLPAEVLQSRDAMAAFLATHAENYRRKKGR